MRRHLALLAVLVGVVGGCAAPPGGTPAPDTPAADTPAATGPDLPPRPREVRVDGLDPCTLLTEADRVALGLDGRPIRDVGPSGLYGGVTELCSIRGFEPRVIVVSVELSVTGGVELFFRPGTPSRITPITVRGFPGIIAAPPIDYFCAAIVDVAPGQLVDVSVSNGGDVPPIPQPGLCVEAERTAGIVLGNLLAAR